MKISTAAKEYLIEIEVRKFTQKTIRSYRNNLNLILRYCETEAQIVDIEDVSLATIRQFTLYMISNGKNHKQRVVPITAVLQKALLKYDIAAENYFTLKSSDDYYFLSNHGRQLTNSAMKNFFGRLKVEMFYGEQFESVEDFIHALDDYIYYYNNERISLKLKGMSPVQYRTHSQTS